MRRSAMLGTAPLLVFLLGVGPCGPITGGRLSGTVYDDPQPNWAALVESTSFCEVEVRPSDPYSFTAVCFDVDGALHVGASAASEKSWPGYVAADDSVRVRFDDAIYPRRAVLLTDPAERAAAYQAKRARMGLSSEGAQPEDDHSLYRLDPA